MSLVQVEFEISSSYQNVIVVCILFYSTQAILITKFLAGTYVVVVKIQHQFGGNLIWRVQSFMREL